jgi:hypothetical protein
MKLRLEGNSIRLRVRKSDLVALEETGICKETLMFPNAIIFNYQLQTDNKTDKMYAHSSAEGLTVVLPLNMATHWLLSDDVGLEATLDSGLYILVEKDFPCKDRPLEDKKDTFFELVKEKENLC